ncbi:MAG: DUF58 domain-containing protein [Candidatus Krumholzibacteriota bacterium]|nr:DUF58 domain-containing protein [Candidatus Krumholzibacteriota bacterium]
MELIARLVVEGFIAGLHRSPFHGFSVEFSEYRPYNPGESAGNVDWKVFAKTDRHYVKLFEEETNLRATLLLDGSRSMDFAGAPDRVTKFRYASLLAAGLAYLLVKQQDAVGLVTFDETIRQVLPARSVRRHLYDLLLALERTEPGGLTDVGATLHRAAEMVKRRGLVILLSDLLDEPRRVLAGLKHFRHRGHEVLVFHVLDPLERDLDLHREVQLEDLETGDRLRTQPWFIRREAGERVRDWIRGLEGECRAHRIDYVPLATDMPFDLALRRVLDRRARMQ